MARRRTPPVEKQVVPPFKPSNARFQKRLIDFDTGSETLEQQHKDWLTESMNLAKVNSAFHVRLYGFASKLGDPKYNLGLSLRRMQSVLNFLQLIDQRTRSFVDGWQHFGESKSGGEETDNSPDWRAVEVHLFIGRPPEDILPNNGGAPFVPNVIPLPGGPRYKEWAVATPGGAFVAWGAGGGFNIFFIRNRKTDELRGYIQPVAGVGGSLGVSGLKLIWNVVQQIVTGVQVAAPDFTDVSTPHPVTWEEMEGCLVRVSSAGAGLIMGGGFAVITFSSSGVYQYGPSGIPIKLAEDLFQFTSVGENWQVGVNASVVIGPIFRVS